jgi:pyrroline-5-carboxylate reductase
VQETKIGFIGAGNMAASIIGGLISQGQPPANVFASDLDAAKLAALATSTGLQAASNTEIAQQADVIVLAVKPQVMAAVCQELAASLGERRPLLISIAAGINLAALTSWFGSDASLVRCMPNTPALVGSGASGLFANPQVDSGQREIANALMGAVGLALWVDTEAQIDSVTALSGSGPAYFFLMLEAMQDSAVKLGLSAEVAKALSYQTALGAAQLALASSETTEQLRRNVTSPNGTTERAINAFEDGDLRGLVDSALKAAHARSIELAEEN